MKNCRKKLAKMLVALLSIFCIMIPFTACSDDDGKIRLSEVTHSIFYAPMYIAMTQGYFEQEGLTIQLSNAGGADKVMTAIASKSADIGLMGPEATIYCHIEGQKDYPVIFGQLTKRDGSFLVGRNPEPDFKWSDLDGKHVLAGRPGGVPAMTLQYVMNNAGIDTDTPKFDTSIDFNNLIGAFEGDSKYDYCTMFEPAASDYQATGKGYIIAAVGAASGEVPFTAFSAKKSYIDKNPERIEKFLRAIIKGYEYMCNNTPAEVAKALQPQFAATSLESIAKAVESYLEIDAWSSTPVMSKEAFERLQDIIQNAGHLSKRAEYSAVVYNDIAKKVLQA